MDINDVLSAILTWKVEEDKDIIIDTDDNGARLTIQVRLGKHYTAAIDVSALDANPDFTLILVMPVLGVLWEGLEKLARDARAFPPGYDLRSEHYGQDSYIYVNPYEDGEPMHLVLPHTDAVALLPRLLDMIV